VIYGTLSGSRVKVINVIKSGESTTSEFAEIDVKYEAGTSSVPGGSTAVFFGQMARGESLLSVDCAVVVSDCLLKNLEHNTWPHCVTEDHCWTKTGQRIENGNTFEDYESGEECTCSFGSLLCSRGLCSCTVSGVKHSAGETWKESTCKECKCEDKGGRCSFQCEEDVCLSFLLPIASSILVVGLLVAFIARRMYKGKDLVDLDSQLSDPARFTPLENSSD
jgi:hypothetical protein